MADERAAGAAAPQPSLIVADADPQRRAELVRFLERHGLTVETAASIAEAEPPAMTRAADLVLVDSSLPGGDPVQLCHRLAMGGGPPAILLADPEADSADCIVALELGAADYVPHDRPRRELLARIRSALRLRAMAASPPQPDGWRLDAERQQITSPAGEVVPVSRTELELMQLFLQHAGQVLSRRQIADLRGLDADEQSERAVDVLVSRLRRKLTAVSPGDDPIRTVHGRGYRLTP